MSSKINSQIVTVDLLKLPEVTGAVTNFAPSIAPTFGRVCVDSADPYHIYLGDGALWRNASGGVQAAGSSVISGITFELGGQASFTNCTMLAQTMSTSLGGIHTLVNFTLTIEQTIASTAPGSGWTTSTPVLPVGYRPLADTYFPCIQNSSVNGVLQSYFIVRANGEVTIHNADSGNSNIRFWALSCSYPAA